MNKGKTRQIYWKLFVIDTIVIVCIVLGMEIYFTSRIQEEKKSENLRDSTRICLNATTDMQHMWDSMSNIEFYAYQMEDVQWFLKYDSETYLERRLNNYSSADTTIYYGVNSLMQNSLSSDESIKSIALISDVQKIMTSFYGDATVHTRSFEGRSQEDFRKELLKSQKDFMVIRDFKDPANGENIGSLAVTYNLDELRELAEESDITRLLIFYKDGKILLNSGEEIDLSQYLKDEGRFLDNEYWTKTLNSYVEVKAVSDVYILTYIPKAIAGNMPWTFWAVCTLIGIALVVFGELMVHLYLKRLTERLNMILTAMEKVSGGDLDVQIQVPEEASKDELDIIALHFNQMCVAMKSYIQKSYLSEIEQKNAELDALQSQINPHFLYNTLEVIRMKAISNKDREVGKMLYSLAVIFRSQIKESNVVTIAKELHFCKKYLELFEYRYHNRFSFAVLCPEELMEVPIIKFVVQPIIENYFVHGIRLEDTDNELNIEVEREEEAILIRVRDNGKGMKKEEIDKKNIQLKEKEERTQGGSIGILNVHTRMEAVYGKGYGVTLSPNQGKGLCITLKLPGEGKKNVQSASC